MWAENDALQRQNDDLRRRLEASDARTAALEASEFEPFRSLRLYDIDVNIPNDPWASLNRTYGPECAYMARVDEHGGVYVDLRRPEHAHLKRPAEITTVDVFGNNN